MNKLKYFRDMQGTVYAYADDGSEDKFIRPSLIRLTPAEVAAHLSPPKDLAALCRALQWGVDAEYQRRMQAIAESYPPYERESWPIQLSEAKACIENPDAHTPWIDACAAKRGLGKNELVARILSKDAAYRLTSGALTGARQAHEDAITQLKSEADALSYNIHHGWVDAVN